MSALDGKYITISYTFASDEGEILGSSDVSGPFTFCYGAGDAIPGLEEFLANAVQGQILRFVIPAEKAYGLHQEALVKILPMSSFPESLNLTIGLELFINNQKMMITEIKDNEVTVDGNHPLSGINLNFELSILNISDEAPQNESHGCGCGGGGCCSNNEWPEETHSEALLAENEACACGGGGCGGSQCAS